MRRHRTTPRGDDYRFWRVTAIIYVVLLLLDLLSDDSDGTYLVGLSVAILGMQVSR